MFQPADIRPVFPYVFKPQIDFGLMSRDLSEYTFGGMLTNIMFLWPVFSLPWLRKKDRALGKLMPLGFVLCSVIICAFDANSAGVLRRYMADGVWGFWIAAVCAWITMSGLIENASTKKKKIFAGIFVLAVTATILYSFCIMFAFGDANSLINTNPRLYYTVGSWFG